MKLLTQFLSTVLKPQHYECDRCGEKLFKASSFILHYIRRCERNTFNCDLCAKTFVTKKSIRWHVMQHRKPEKCELCSRPVKNLSKHQLKQHNFNCNLCPHKCSTKKYHTWHLMTHRRHKKCGVCGNSYKELLKHQIKSHTVRTFE